MSKSTKNTKRGKAGKFLLRAARIVVPITILTLIFFKIDFDQFKLTLQKTDLWLILLGLAHSPLLILIGALRWRVLLRSMVAHRQVSFGFATNNYWISLSLGFFSPASLGMDAFRAITCGRKFGSYTAAVSAIVVEKFIALLNCTSLILILYPFIPVAASPFIEKISQTAVVMLVAVVFVVPLTILLFKNQGASSYFMRTGKCIERYSQKLINELGGRLMARQGALSFRTILSSFRLPLAASVFLFSLAIQIVSSIKSQVFFVSLGYDLSFIVNLFVAPTLYFIFLLPISLGSIGIREGVYILLYGLFGVPSEIALIVSLLNFSGMLVNAAIGGIIMFFYKTEEAESL